MQLTRSNKSKRESADGSMTTMNNYDKAIAWVWHGIASLEVEQRMYIVRLYALCEMRIDIMMSCKSYMQ